MLELFNSFKFQQQQNKIQKRKLINYESARCVSRNIIQFAQLAYTYQNKGKTRIKIIFGVVLL